MRNHHGPAIGRAPHVGDHATLSYTSLAELIDAVIPFISEGLSSGDLVLYLCDDHNPDEIRHSLEQRDQLCSTALASGQLAIMTSRAAFFKTGSFNVEGSLDSFCSALRAAQSAGFRRIRAVCEMTYLLAAVPGIHRAPEFESRANVEIFGKFPFLCICPMNLLRDVSDTWAGIQATHPTLYVGGAMVDNPAYAGLRSAQGA